MLPRFSLTVIGVQRIGTAELGLKTRARGLWWGIIYLAARRDRRRVTITEKEGGVERKTNLTLPSYVWVGGETAKWPNAAEGETVAAFLCLFGMSDPPQRKSYFLLRVCFLWEGECTGREVWQKLHRGGGIHQVGGYDPPPSVVDATADWVRQYAPKGGRPGKGQTKRGPDVVVVEPDAPPPP